MATIHHNIKGAPFEIGATVRVKKVVDETGNKAFIGKIGKIVYYSYDGGCGEVYPHEPMLGIGFEHGKLDQYWPEELEKVSDGRQ